ncbi:MAG TPA: hypothetical protein VME19_01975 [Streptosporangiaceae bacterium]|nr:hypothetical protein [Streptosporangiaceae bacterium]
MEPAGVPDREPGIGLVYLRRLNDATVWPAGITVTARPHPESQALCNPMSDYDRLADAL